MHNKVKYADIKQANELLKEKFSESDGDPHKTWQVINKPILLIIPAGLLLRNGVSITNSTALSNALDDHFSTIMPETDLQNTFISNGSNFQQFKYLRPLSKSFQIHPH